MNLLRKLLITVLFFGLCVSPVAAQSPYPANTTPSTGDDLITCMEKLIRLLNDSKTNASPLYVNGTSGGAGVSRTPTITIATSSGSVASGARSVTFIPFPNYVGTILSCPVSGTNGGLVTGAMTFNAGGNGDTLTAISYTVTSGSIAIQEIQ